MRIQPRFILVSCIGTVALLGGVAAWNRSGSITIVKAKATQTDGRPRDFLALGKQAFAGVAMVDLSTIDSLEAAEGALAGLDITDARGAVRVRFGPTSDGANNNESAAIAREVRKATASWIYSRLISRDAQAYAQSRREQGAKANAIDQLESRHRFSEWYQKAAGKPQPADLTVDRLLVDLFAFEQDSKSTDRIVGLASDPAGLSAVIGELTPAHPSPPMIEGRISAELWHGSSSLSPPRLFGDYDDLTTRIRSNGRVTYVSVGLLMTSASGARFPVHLGLVRAGDGSFALDRVAINNFDDRAFINRMPMLLCY